MSAGFSRIAARGGDKPEAAHRREILETGYPPVHKRGEALKELAGKLHAEVLDPEKRWLKDVKVVGKGKSAREVTLLRFNAAETEQLRGVLADLAKETGGRKDMTVLAGDHGSPLEIRHEDRVDLTKLTNDKLGQLEHIIRRASTTSAREIEHDQDGVLPR